MTKLRPLVRTALAACALLLAVSDAEARVPHHARGAGEPVLVELFTAQGCATCPAANGVIGALADRKGVVPLTFSVDYWDYLGWEDTLAKPEFDARQRAYVQRLKVREIYTPEIVVGGKAESAALDHKKIDGLIAAAERERRPGPRLTLLRHDSRVQVSGSGPGEVWLIRYDPKPQSAKIKAGDNKGQTVVVRNAVRELKRIALWRGGARTYPIPAADEDEGGLKTVVVVQAPRGGRVLALVRD